MNRSDLVVENIEKLEQQLTTLREERNQLIKNRFSELFNVNTWNKIKLGYVYSTIAKEFRLKAVTVIKILKS